MKKVSVAGAISVAITWFHGGIIFKPEEKWAKAWYGICHMGNGILAFAPIDYEKVTMVTSIDVSPEFRYCERSDTCVYFDCIYNRFSREKFLRMFGDCGSLTLGLPHDFGSKPLWFNEGIYIQKWKYFKIGHAGGVLIHKDQMGG